MDIETDINRHASDQCVWIKIMMGTHVISGASVRSSTGNDHVTLLLWGAEMMYTIICLIQLLNKESGWKSGVKWPIISFLFIEQTEFFFHLPHPLPQSIRSPSSFMSLTLNLFSILSHSPNVSILPFNMVVLFFSFFYAI